MKICASLLAAVVAVVVAADVDQASPSLSDQWNSTANTTALPLELRAARVCKPPATALPQWWYLKDNIFFKTPVDMKVCDTGFEATGRPWNMLNAYRSGGTKGLNWRHIKNCEVGDCLRDWAYYDKDGKSFITKVKGFTTTIGDKDNKPWCALPVYQPDGKRGFQWDYCTC